jgi:L-alanine-DL-glutamate epimerase-like enolase superfamily enzyme
MARSTQVHSASARTAARPPLAIRRVDAIPVALPLKKPVAMSGVTIGHAENVLVRIEATDGTVGWGEAAAAPTMTGDTQGGLIAALRHLAPLLTGQDAWQRTELARRLRAALFGNTGAHAAIDMALLDVASRAAGVPLIDLLGGKKRERVHPMWLLGNATMQEDVAEACARERDGFHFFKLKVATKPLARDIATTHAVREALAPDTLLCADANCGFALETARGYLEGTRPAGLLFLEQPLHPADLEGLAVLSRSSGIPIGADEGIHSLADVEAHARAGIGGVSLKLIKLGGFDVALEAAGVCQHLGLKVNVAAKIAESSIGTAAAVHLACAVPSIDWGVSLTSFCLAEDIVKDPVPLRDGSVALPAGFGLGIDVDEVAVARFRVH